MAIYGINIVRMGSKHENTGRFAPVRKRETLEKTIIFLLTKQFVQKNKCNLCKKTIFLYRIAVALRMECVDLSPVLWLFQAPMQSRTPHGVRGFKFTASDLILQFCFIALRMKCVDFIHCVVPPPCFSYGDIRRFHRIYAASN